MGLYQGVYDGQPNPVPSSLVVRMDQTPGTGPQSGMPVPVSVTVSWTRRAPLALPWNHSRRESQDSSLRHRLDRIQDEVQQHLFIFAPSHQVVEHAHPPRQRTVIAACAMA